MATKSRNDTPNTPEVSESKIARMKADDLRKELKSRGVKGTAELRKPELVKKMIKTAVAESKPSGGAKKSAGSKKSAGARSAGAKKAAGAKESVSAKVSSGGGNKASGRNPTSHNDTPNTPEVSESKIARMKVVELRQELKKRGVKGTGDLNKADLVQKLIKQATASAAKPGPATGSKAKPAGSTKSAKSARVTKSAKAAGGGKRTGRSTSKSVR